MGDADKAMPDRHHNAMEPHATLAVWDDDGALTLYDSTQMVVGTRKLASLVFSMPEEKINVVCEFLGGGFGGKSWSWPHTLLAALAAKVVNRPVRLQLTRAQMYSMAGHQAATVQTITLGADREGRLTGIRHDSAMWIFHGSCNRSNCCDLSKSGQACDDQNCENEQRLSKVVFH